MSEETPEASVPPPPEPAPVPSAPPPPPNRRLSTWLAALYAAAVAASALILLRGESRDDKRPHFKAPGGILSAIKDKDLVGVISINGPIFESEGGGVFAHGSQAWARKLEKMAEKKEVKSIVLLINSPGGSVGAVQELHSLILRVRREHKKPVVAHLGDVAASGGYYLAVACDKVVAHPGTLLGSIGVIFHTSNIEGLMAKLGVKAEVIKSGKMKDIGSMTRPMTPEERALLQATINDTYGQFLGAVADGRKLPEEKIRPLADGRVFTGKQALALGLVDQLGDSQDAIGLAGQLGGIKGKPKVLRDSESLSNVLELLDSRLPISAPAAWLDRFRELTFCGLEYFWSR